MGEYPDWQTCAVGAAEQSSDGADAGGGEALAVEGALVLLVSANTSTASTSTTHAANPALLALPRPSMTESVPVDLIGSPARADPQLGQKPSPSGTGGPFAHVPASAEAVRGPRSRIAVSVSTGLPHRAQKRAVAGFL